MTVPCSFASLLACSFVRQLPVARVRRKRPASTRDGQTHLFGGRDLLYRPSFRGPGISSYPEQRSGICLTPGWNITIVPAHPEGSCDEFASVLNPPYRAHRDLYIDRSYGWTAEEEVASSPREFNFVTNCEDFRTESERLSIVLWPYTATQKKYDEALTKLGSSSVWGFRRS